MHRETLLFFVVGLGVLLSGASEVVSAETRANGEIRGRVVQKQGEKERPLADQPVRLSIFEKEVEIGGTETRTDARGYFRFSRLHRNAEHTYQVWLERFGVPFLGEIIRFDKNRVRSAPPLVIHPTTGNPSAISATGFVLVEFGSTDILKITHSIELQNNGEITYDPRREGATPIAFSLLSDGFSLQLGRGLDTHDIRVDSHENQLRLGFPVPAGPTKEITVEFSYLYRTTQRSLTFDFVSNISWDRFGFLTNRDDIVVSTSKLTPQSPGQIRDQKYRVFSGGPFEPDTAVRIHLSGFALPKDTAFKLLFAGLGLVMLAALVLWFRGRKKLSPELRNQQDREAHYAMIVKLERNLRRGEISRAEYLEERERVSELLFDLLQDQPKDVA